MIRHSHEEVGLFTVWQEFTPASNASFYVPSAKQAAEAKARADWSDGHATWPTTYCVRDGESGTIWAVDVALEQQPAFAAINAREIAMPAATHVLWGGHVLCEDLRLRTVPGDWPVGQRWISLKDVADGAEFQERYALPDRCEACWAKVPFLVEQIGKAG